MEEETGEKENEKRQVKKSERVKSERVRGRQNLRQLCVLDNGKRLKVKVKVTQRFLCLGRRKIYSPAKS